MLIFWNWTQKIGTHSKKKSSYMVAMSFNKIAPKQSFIKKKKIFNVKNLLIKFLLNTLWEVIFLQLTEFTLNYVHSSFHQRKRWKQDSTLSTISAALYWGLCSDRRPKPLGSTLPATSLHGSKIVGISTTSAVNKLHTVSACGIILVPSLVGKALNLSSDERLAHI